MGCRAGLDSVEVSGGGAVRSLSAFGVRGDLRADDERCPSCDLPLVASPVIERIRSPVEMDDGTITTQEVEFVVGVCVCAFRWAIWWGLR